MESDARGLRSEAVPGDVALRPTDRSQVLTVNGGSSSLKFALFDRADPPARRASGRIERIVLPSSRVVVAWTDGKVEESGIEVPDRQAATRLLVS
jgi:acetate kinase